MANTDRPLSPHLQIYRWPITMASSILHRATGVGLGIGTLLLAWWLVAAAAGPEHFALVQGVLASWIGRLIMLGFSFALFFHLCNGIRHLAWDLGHGFEKVTARNASIAVFVFSGLLTALAWLLAFIWK